ncbi:hypothetical protein VTI74DRAFT_8259 [Chaetomium olivicolor]
MHETLLWPPPDGVRANIQRATGGSLSTPGELYTKAKDAIDRGQFENLVNDDEVTLLAWGFHATDDPASYAGARMAAVSAPGAGPVMQLLSNPLELCFTTFKTAALRQLPPPRQMAPALPALGPGPSPATVPSLPMSGRGFTVTAAPQGQVGQGQDPAEILRAI